MISITITITIMGTSRFKAREKSPPVNSCDFPTSPPLSLLLAGPRIVISGSHDWVYKWVIFCCLYFQHNAMPSIVQYAAFLADAHSNEQGIQRWTKLICGSCLKRGGGCTSTSEIKHKHWLYFPFNHFSCCWSTVLLDKRICFCFLCTKSLFRKSSEWLFPIH